MDRLRIRLEIDRPIIWIGAMCPTRLTNGEHRLLVEIARGGGMPVIPGAFQDAPGAFQRGLRAPRGRKAWPTRSWTAPDALKQAISRLRIKIGAQYLLTARGQGYMTCGILLAAKP